MKRSYVLALALAWLPSVSAVNAEELRVRVVDQQGRPVQAAFVCLQCASSKAYTRLEPKSYRTDEQGMTVLNYKNLKPPLLLYAHHYWTLAGLQRIENVLDGEVVEMTVAPSVIVHGKVGNSALEDRGFRFDSTRVLVGIDGQTVLSYQSAEQRFQFYLPPGRYEFQTEGSDLEKSTRFVNVKDGASVCDLGTLESSGAKILQLTGEPAPELPRLRDWTGNSPSTLAELQGKVVILEFWDYRNNNYLGRMYDLWKLQASLAKHGLVILAVHNASLRSVQELEQKIDLPAGKLGCWSSASFSIAIDAAESESTERTYVAPGKATAVYGIQSFPTAVLINRDGKVVGRFNPRSRNDVLRLRDWLGLVEPTDDLPPKDKPLRRW